jgi:hypothetical protein
MTDDFILNNFTSGQIGAKLHDRVDLVGYHNGVAQMTNFIPLPHGGVTKRTGTVFHAECKTTAGSKLIPFKSSSSQNFILEVGDAYIRFHKVGSPNARVETSPGVAYEISSPYGSSQFREFDYSQSNDYMFMAHSAVKVKQLARVADTNWVISDLDPQDGPYLTQNTTSVTLNPGAVTGAIVITASAAMFDATFVGRLIRIKHNGIWGSAKVTGLISTVAVTAQVQTGYDFNAAATTSKKWALGAWSDTRGWPARTTLHEGRLAFAATNTQPQTLWESVTDDYDTFSPTLPDPDSISNDPTHKVTDECALNLTLASNELNYIKWLYSGNNIILGADTGEFPITSGSLDEPLTPTNARARRQTTTGSSTVKPIQVENNLLFVDRSGLKVHELKFDADFNNYTASDLTRLIDDIVVNPIRQMAYSKNPYRTVWIVAEGGELYSFTYFPEEKVIGWCSHTISGDNTRVESVAVAPSSDGSFDEVWLIVSREINNVGKHYIEILDQYRIDGRFSELKSQYKYLDSCKTVTGTDMTTITGLSHLNGETVQVVADGNYVGNKTVSGNQITLDTAADTVHVGYKFDSTIKTLRLEVPTQKQTSLGKIRRVTHFDISVYKTLGLKYGVATDKLYELPFRNVADPMDASPPLFTGVKRDIKCPGGENEDQLFFVHDKPFPCTIRSIIFKAIVSK